MKYMNFSKANCKNCYKCLRGCPVKAIKFKNDQAEIEEDRCIACSHCLSICPQNARNVVSDLEKVKLAVNSSREVVVSLAPSFAGFFKVEYGKVVTLLKKLGFSYVHETAQGAEIVADLYNEYVNKNEYDNYITTSCPSVNYLVEKYYPELIKYMIPVVSPMIAHGMMLKKSYGKDAFVVFIGPCVAKKIEGEGGKKVINAILTFDEIEQWMADENINLDELETSEFNSTKVSGGRSFPLGGGILECMGADVSGSLVESVTVTGMEDCIGILDFMKENNPKGLFVEASACKGSCIGGPKIVKGLDGYYNRLNRVKKYIEMRKGVETECQEIDTSNLSFNKNFRDKSLRTKEPSETQVVDILKKLGKYSSEDELNCGVCGYNTCREKAKAIYQGMSETSMCLHFMRSKAESLSNVIIENTPHSIAILDSDMIIKDVNASFENTFLAKKENIIGQPVTILIDDEDFIKVKETKINIVGKKVRYLKYNAVFIQNIIYLEKQDVILISMTNIIAEEKSREAFLKVKQNSLNAADEIITKQMRVAQEIAGILGETTAETKLILMELRKVIASETGEVK